MRPRALRRRAIEDDGFTLVELLVVVIVIGILAAVAIPVYLGMQGNAKDAGVRSDLSNARTALSAVATWREGGVPTDVTAEGSATIEGTTRDLAPYGWSLSSNTRDLAYSTQGTGSAVRWCVLGTSRSGKRFSISSSTSITGGTSTSTCPATY